MKHLTPCFALVLLVAEASPAAVDLKLKSAVEAEIAGGQTQEYGIPLEAGQFARLDLDQISINAVMAVFAPDGSKLFEVRSSSAGSPESAQWIAKASGRYRVALTPAAEKVGAGRYSLVLSAVETATEQHENLVALSREQIEGNALWVQHTRDSVLKAVTHFEAAARYSRAAQDPGSEALFLYFIGLAYAEIGERDKAVSYVDQALPIAHKCGNKRIEAWALNSKGTVLNAFGDRREAVKYFEQALPIMRTTGDRSGEATILNNLGMAHARMGEKPEALRYFEEGVALYEQLNERRQMASLLSNIGFSYGELGEYQKALHYYSRAIALHRESGSQVGEAIVLNNFGSIYSSLSRYQEALASYNSALEIHKTLERKWDVAINLHNIAWVYGQLGNKTRALKIYQEALDILRVVKDPSALAKTLSAVGLLLADSGDHRKALEMFDEGLRLRRIAKDRDGEGISLNNIGSTYAKLGETTKAREYLQESIAIHRSTGDKRALALALRNLKPDGLNEALQIFREIQDRRGEADTLSDLAKVARDKGDLREASIRAKEALNVMESLRSTVTSPALRASFFAAARKAQEIEIESLMALKEPEQAFLASERARARTLLETLGESNAEIRKGADTALLAREREVELLISAKAQRQTKLLNGKHSNAEAIAVAKELDTLLAELEQVQATIRTTSPAYAALTRPEPLSIPCIQSQVLDKDTVLLEYSLGTERSFLWVVTASTVDSYELPSREKIETAARRVYDQITTRQVPSATEISRMLLSPAARQIAGKRLLIVTEGALHYLPFSALPDPSKPAPLIVNHEIVMAPSASVLSVIRQESANRNPAPKLAAVIADPVFNADDPRVQQSNARLEETNFLRLRFSRNEAESISRISPQTVTYQDFDASREKVLSGKLAQYRIVHFATHSVLDNERPELSGVVLSLFDRKGRPQDGFLRLYDIYNLRLNAELVVLSACRTALGQEVKGEGLIGLTRGFLYAGAPRVIATSWAIDDRTTSEVMRRFYEALLIRHERPAAALRSAQIDMWKTKGWDAPYNWAAFQLQGEWR